MSVLRMEILRQLIFLWCYFLVVNAQTTSVSDMNRKTEGILEAITATADMLGKTNMSLTESITDELTSKVAPYNTTESTVTKTSQNYSSKNTSITSGLTELTIESTSIVSMQTPENTRSEIELFNTGVTKMTSDELTTTYKNLDFTSKEPYTFTLFQNTKDDRETFEFAYKMLEQTTEITNKLPTDASEVFNSTTNFAETTQAVSFDSAKEEATINDPEKINQTTEGLSTITNDPLLTEEIFVPISYDVTNITPKSSEYSTSPQAETENRSHVTETIESSTYAEEIVETSQFVLNEFDVTQYTPETLNDTTSVTRADGFTPSSIDVLENTMTTSKTEESRNALNETDLKEIDSLGPLDTLENATLAAEVLEGSTFRAGTLEIVTESLNNTGVLDSTSFELEATQSTANVRENIENTTYDSHTFSTVPNLLENTTDRNSGDSSVFAVTDFNEVTVDGITENSNNVSDALGVTLDYTAASSFSGLSTVEKTSSNTNASESGFEKAPDKTNLIPETTTPSTSTTDLCLTFDFFQGVTENINPNTDASLTSSSFESSTSTVGISNSDTAMDMSYFSRDVNGETTATVTDEETIYSMSFSKDNFQVTETLWWSAKTESFIEFSQTDLKPTVSDVNTVTTNDIVDNNIATSVYHEHETENTREGSDNDSTKLSLSHTDSVTDSPSVIEMLYQTTNSDITAFTGTAPYDFNTSTGTKKNSGSSTYDFFEQESSHTASKFETTYTDKVTENTFSFGAQNPTSATNQTVALVKVVNQSTSQTITPAKGLNQSTSPTVAPIQQVNRSTSLLTTRTTNHNVNRSTTQQVLSAVTNVSTVSEPKQSSSTEQTTTQIKDDTKIEGLTDPVYLAIIVCLPTLLVVIVITVLVVLVIRRRRAKFKTQIDLSCYLYEVTDL